MGRRLENLFIVTAVLLLMIVPVLDQLACPFCAPNEGSALTLHFEKGQLLPEECAGRHETPVNGDTASHVHCCTLHSTVVSLNADVDFRPEKLSSTVFVAESHFEVIETSTIFHPPRIS